MVEVIKSYYEVINNMITKEEGLNRINSLGLTISNQFMENDSVYNPKEFE